MKENRKIICFSADTLVSTPSGLMRIDAILPGMEVMGYDVDSGLIVKDVVKHFFTTLHNVCASFVLDDGTCTRLTADHPVYVLGKEWCSIVANEAPNYYGVSVRPLEEGDCCVCFSKGGIGAKRVVAIERKEFPADCYCIATEKYHTFIANGLVAHDVCVGLLPKKRLAYGHISVE